MHASWAFQGLENLNLGRVDEVLEPGNPYFLFRRVPAGVGRGVGAPQRLIFFLARRRRPLDEEPHFGLAFKLP